MTKREVANLLALAVLSYLSRAPMHPYELGRMLREHGDARSVKYTPSSLYMVVGQLERAGLITAQGPSREGRRPERTVYALTDAGRAELGDWLRELVAEPRHEYPHFVTALSLIGRSVPTRSSSCSSDASSGSPRSAPRRARRSTRPWRAASTRCSSWRRSTGSRCWTPSGRSSRASSPASPTRRPAGARRGPRSTKQEVPA